MNSFKRNKVSLLTAIALIFFSILNFLLLTNQDNTPQRYGNKVINVIDGDTIVVNKGVLVRLHGLDAPALEYCGGEQAKKALKELVLNNNVSLEQIALGEHKRILALVYVKNTLVNEILLKNGHAELFGAQTSAKEKLQQANQYARENKKGIYGECILNTPPDPKCNIKANIDPRDKTKIYHLPNCPNYKTTIIETFRGENWFCSEEEAQKAGFRKAQNCPTP